MTRHPPELPGLTPAQEAWLLAVTTATVLPHLPFAPTWLTFTAAALLGWRALLWWRRMPLPPRWLLSLLVVAAGLAVFLDFQRLFGRDPGIAVLLCLLCLKSFESRRVRDGLTQVFLAWFLQLGLFFYSQSMATAALAAANLLLSVAALGALCHATRPAGAILRLTGRMLLQAVPLMLVLFLFFPRVQGPLWGMPADAFAGSSGLSDSMAPGSIASLSLSDAIAFRVRFEGPPPAQGRLYWRGPVLSRFDGRTWRPAPSRIAPALPYALPTSGSPLFRYTVTLEAHNRPWLFALELPVSLPAGDLMSADYRLLTGEPVRARLRYDLASRPDLRVGAAETPQTLRESLALPPRVNPRARALAATWVRGAGGAEAILAQALSFFRGNGFTYTLQPPLLGQDGIDEFLFDSRRGFCEHFSGAFVFLMRAAGVPARVVTGYQGGEFNPVDGFLVVRQADAHAWAEVWIENLGWRRVDPTVAAAPARVDTGLSAAIPRGEALPFGLRNDLGWLTGLRWQWDALANGWNQWILGYNPERQRQLLGRMGLPDPDWRSLTTLMAGVMSMLMLALLAWALRRPEPRDPALRAWDRLSGKLARAGLKRLPQEGPLDYRQRVVRARPDLAADMTRLTALYIGCRYGGNPEQCHRLVRAVAALRIR